MTSSFRAPVDRDLGLIRETLFVELQEDPLGPSVIRRIRRRDLALPVIGKPKRLQLAAKPVDVFQCGFARMGPGFDRVIFCRQPEGVPPHRVQHIKPAHAFISHRDIGGGVALGMADMQTVAARIRKHIKHIVFGLRGIGLKRRAKRVIRRPIPLPLFLNVCKRITRHDDTFKKAVTISECHQPDKHPYRTVRISRANASIFSPSKRPRG